MVWKPFNNCSFEIIMCLILLYFTYFFQNCIVFIFISSNVHTYCYLSEILKSIFISYRTANNNNSTKNIYDVNYLY